MRRKFSWLAAAFLMISASFAQAQEQAYVDITVDISEQEMYVQTPIGDVLWPVSTGRSGYKTPTGEYTVKRMEKMWYSRKYDDAPMPHSIFFHGGYAIHATYDLKRLGRPASHGCVRLHPQAAEYLFDVVKYFGAENTVVRVVP